MSARKRLRGKDGKFISKDPVILLPVDKRPASERTLEVPELLDIILLQLPMKDLLLAQRVSKSWREHIPNSLPIRRALFLEPVKEGNVTYMDWRLDDKDWYDDLGANLNLGEHVRGPNRDEKPRVYSTHWGKTRDDDGKYRVFVNPLLTNLFPLLKVNGIYWNEAEEDLPKSAQEPTASWRKMFFTQPPVHSMAVEWDSSKDGDGNSDWTISGVQKRASEKGLTMGCLFGRLEVLERPVWIEGRQMWREYRCAEDLGRVCTEDESWKEESLD